MDLVAHAIGVLAGYLLGSIPTGYLVARARGIDIRATGSGNIGATNVFRILGRTAGVLVLLTDALKGWLACILGPALVQAVLPTDPAGSQESLRLLCGVSAVLGHNYPCWLRFRGGKGIATSAGVLVALMPAAFGIATAAWIVTFALSRYVSLASMAAAMALPLAAWFTGTSDALLVAAAALAILALYRHRSNAQRLLQGTEHRFGKTTPPA